MFIDHIDRLQPELLEPPVRNEADKILDLLRRHTVGRAHLGGEVDEIVLKPERCLANIGGVILHRPGQALKFLAEGVEHLDDASAMQALVVDRPGDDLTHALHLVELWEVHQYREAGEELGTLGEASEHRQRECDVLVIVDAEVQHAVMLLLHLGIIE